MYVLGVEIKQYGLIHSVIVYEDHRDTDIIPKSTPRKPLRIE